MAADKLDRAEASDLKATLALFESNVEKARTAFQSLTQQKIEENWTMKVGDHVVIGPMPRAIVLRGFLFNHIYHHRGELVVYLRATRNKVPSIYGPTYEDSIKDRG